MGKSRALDGGGDAGSRVQSMSWDRALTGTPGSFLPFGDDATWARYWMTFLVFSVFPAPDSPLWGTQEGKQKGLTMMPGKICPFQAEPHPARTPPPPGSPSGLLTCRGWTDLHDL